MPYDIIQTEYLLSTDSPQLLGNKAHTYTCQNRSPVNRLLYNDFYQLDFTGLKLAFYRLSVLKILNILSFIPHKLKLMTTPGYAFSKKLLNTPNIRI